MPIRVATKRGQSSGRSLATANPAAVVRVTRSVIRGLVSSTQSAGRGKATASDDTEEFIAISAPTSESLRLWTGLDRRCVTVPGMEMGERLGAVFARQTEVGVVSAYLFGSEAEGRAHRESDVDVGVLLDSDRFPTEKERFEVRLRLAGDCARRFVGARSI